MPLILVYQLELKIKVQNLKLEQELLVRYEDVDNYNVYGAYFSTKTKLSDKVSLQFAGRYDKYPQIGESSFAPRAAIVYNPSNKHKMRLTFNKAYVAPSALNLFVDLAVQKIPGGYGNVVDLRK